MTPETKLVWYVVAFIVCTVILSFISVSVVLVLLTH